MRRFLLVFTLLAAAACSDDDDAAPADEHGDHGDHGGHDAEDSGVPGTPDSGAVSCTSALETLLTPKDAVSTGEVIVLEEGDGERTLYIDASAGGSMAAAGNPRLYLDLGTGKRVDVSDVTAASSTDWDLALKRPVLFANSGDGGPGDGGAVLVETDYDAVTTADAEAAVISPESFVEADCTPKLDQTNAVRTSFDGWYEYDTSNNRLTPKAGTWIVKGGAGALYKVQLLSSYANPDGTEGEAGGRYTLKVGAL